MQVLVGTVVLLAGLTASAGVVLDSAELDPASGKVRSTTTVRAEDGKLRMEHYEGTKQTAVMIFKDDVLYVLDPADSSYVLIDRASIRQIADTVNPALEQMQAQLERLPPEQRAMVEQMLNDSMPGGLGGGPQPLREVRRTGRVDEVAGMSCRIHEMLADGLLEREVCVAAAGSMPGGLQFYAALSRMGRLMQELMDSIDAPWLKQSIDEQWTNVEKLEGVPIRGREYQNDEVVSELVVKDIREEVAPAGSFGVPEGYTRREITGE
jgi:hypothetical protein